MGCNCSQSNKNKPKHNISQLKSIIGNDIILQKIISASKTMNYNFDKMNLQNLDFLDDYEKKISKKDSASGKSNKEINSIKVFSAYNNKIKNFPKEFFKGLTKVIKIDMSFNILNSVDPCICEIEFIKYIILNNNKLTSLPKNFNSLKHLKELNLANNLLISEEISHKLDELENIESINLSGNILKTFPIEILKNKLLSNLDVNSNIIEDNIQMENWKDSSLVNLDLSFNKLKIGNICSDIMKNSKVSNLNLKGNLVKLEELKSIEGFEEFIERRKQRKNQGFIHNLAINFDFCGLD